MLAKLGISHASHAPFITKTLQQMANARADFTRFFTALTRNVAGKPAHLSAFFISPLAEEEWTKEWKTLLAPSALTLMQGHNPVYIARNHRVEAALKAAEAGNIAMLHELLMAVQNPFDERSDFTRFEDAPGPQEEVLLTFCGT